MSLPLVLASLLGCVLLALAFFPAQGGTLITVDTTNDEFNTDGDCSLREAIYSANDDSSYDNCPAGDGADIIVIPAGTYTITIEGLDNTGDEGDFDILSDMTLQGAGVGVTIIDGGVSGLGHQLIGVPDDTYSLTITILTCPHYLVHFLS